MNGLIVLDKPAGMTSHDVVYQVRRATGEKSVGHLGTLDPMVTGVLPLMLGKYTRLAQFFGSAEKEYVGTIRFGWSTDTFDADGERTSEPAACSLDLERLRAMAATFHGEMDQVPPVFSAKKINGVPAYKLARAGKDVPVKAARINIHAFEILSFADGVAEFRMRVSAGGYVRSVAHDLGKMAGCGAHLATLRRTHAGQFSLTESITVERMKELAVAGELERALPHPRTLLPEIPSVMADEGSVTRLRNGMAVNLPEFSGSKLVKVFAGPRELVGIGKRIAGTLIAPMVNL